MININDTRNYKKCQKKLYDIYVSKPPIGTVIINKLEQAGIAKQLGKTYFTPEEFSAIPNSTQLIQSKMVYVVSEEQPYLLAGTVGEMWLIDEKRLCKTYNFITSNGTEDITPDKLKSKMKNKIVLDWTPIKSKPNNNTLMACFVPKNQPGQIQTAWGSILNYNDPSVSHGKGDFIVCDKNPDGTPNLNSRWVVNGLIFAVTYNNTTWTDYLDLDSAETSITKADLPKIDLNPKTPITYEDYVKYCSNVTHILEGLIRPYKDYNSHLMVLCPEDKSRTDGISYKKGTNEEIISEYLKTNKSKYDTMIDKLVNFVKTTKVIDDCSLITYGEERTPNNKYLRHTFVNMLVGLAYFKLFTGVDKSLSKQGQNIQNTAISNAILGLDLSLSLANIYSGGTEIRYGLFKGIKCSFDYHALHDSLEIQLVLTDLTTREVLRLVRLDIDKTKESIEKSINKLYKYIFVEMLNNYDTTKLVIPEYRYGVHYLIDLLNHITKSSVVQQNQSGVSLTKLKLGTDKENYGNYSFFMDGATINAEYNDGTRATYRPILSYGANSSFVIAYTELCRKLNIHPAKSLYSAKSTWNIVESHIRQDANKTYGLCIKLQAINTSDPLNIKVRFGVVSVGNQDKIIGERTLSVDLDYENWSKTKKITSEDIQAILNDNSEFSSVLKSLVVNLKISGEEKDSKGTISLDEFENPTYSINGVISMVQRLLLDLYHKYSKYRISVEKSASMDIIKKVNSLLAHIKHNDTASPLVKCKIELIKQDNNVVVVLHNKLDGDTKTRPLGIDTIILAQELKADYNATLQKIVSLAYSMLSE